ncbi:hypothetical protein [Halobacterium sp. CBA1126]|uniref:hypothetical protein n=1 Tax=Halobacterium sp. CBA1126 TaxID=2668074 RepID=UPI0012F8C2CC|nr:hypothetical protein [Halobacterium sp. CBA1126]MUV61379.1 hypothetical protein [Halobacterium sp. CBA1126]
MSESVFSANRFTFREWHAGVLGACVGAVAGYLHAIEYTTLGAALAVVFVAAALGLRRYGSVAGRTVRRERGTLSPRSSPSAPPCWRSPNPTARRESGAR